MGSQLFKMETTLRVPRSRLSLEFHEASLLVDDLDIFWSSQAYVPTLVCVLVMGPLTYP